MNLRHKISSFKKEVAPLLELVTNDIYLESIWLGNMSMLEDIAAKHILNNITDATPDEAIRGIIGHVKDEQRHARLLQEMRPVTIYPDHKYYLIEEEWKKIAEAFILGFFNSSLLREVNHRHAAYVHGAQTIERFPFRVYSLYFSMSKLPKVKVGLPGIIADENGHIELGKSMYAKLDEGERMPLTKLYQLEEELCLMMLKRMNLALRQSFNLYEPDLSSELEFKITQNTQLEVAWNYALSCGESYFSTDRARHIIEANTFNRVALRHDKNFRELERVLTATINNYITKIIALGVSESAILNRFNNHYSEMIYNTNNVPLHHAYFRILEGSPAIELDVAEVNLEKIFWNELKLEISNIGIV